MKPKDNPSWLLDLHRWLAGLAVVFTGIHMASLFIDEYAAFTFPRFVHSISLAVPKNCIAWWHGQLHLA
jgi:hypothetical protein